MAKNNKKQGLNLYEVTYYYHTNGVVRVKASSEEEALRLADSGSIPDDVLLEGLQEDDTPDVELVEENVEPMDGIVTCYSANTIGASFHGVVIRSTVNKLEKVLGKPTNGDGGCKVSYVWPIKVVHEGDEFVASVYDWKDGRFDKDQVVEFHVGGFDRQQELIVKGYIEEKLDTIKAQAIQ